VPPPLSKEHTEYPKKWMNPKFGSIVAGGRYDTLVSAFVAGSVSSNPNSKEYTKRLLVIPYLVWECPLAWIVSLAEISGKGSQD